MTRTRAPGTQRSSNPERPVRCWTINGMRACKSYTFWLLEACVHPQDADLAAAVELITRTVLEPGADGPEPTRAKGGEVKHERQSARQFQEDRGMTRTKTTRAICDEEV